MSDLEMDRTYSYHPKNQKGHVLELERNHFSVSETVAMVILD